MEGCRPSLPLCRAAFKYAPCQGALPLEQRIQALVERDEGLDGPAGIDARGTDEARQQLRGHDGSVEERTKEWHLCTQAETARVRLRFVQSTGAAPTVTHRSNVPKAVSPSMTRVLFCHKLVRPRCGNQRP